MPIPITTFSVNDDDDWLDPPTQGGAADPLVHQEYSRLASRYSDAGYREGITDGKLSTLQAGFDEGFALSVPLSRQIGILRGKAASLLAFATSSPAAKLAQPPSSAIEETRNLIRDLSHLRRDDILPLDQERLAHERLEHPENDDNAFELERNDARDMEGLERSLGLLGAKSESNNAELKSGEEILKQLESRLDELRRQILPRL